MLHNILVAVGMLSLFGIVIGVHEYGHYRAMIRYGVKVPEFYIGFGPVLWQRQLKSGTVFKVRLLWLGGAAQPEMKGPNSMETATRWQKFVIYLAGMAVNVALAAVIMTACHLIDGTYLAKLAPFVGWAPGPVKSIISGLVEPLIYWFLTPVVVFATMFNPVEFMQNTSGPVGIVAMGSEAMTKPTVAESLLGWFRFLGVINAALAGFNLLPIGPLDGGRIVGLALDKLFGQKWGPKVEQGYLAVGLVLFLYLIVMAFLGDGALWLLIAATLILGGPPLIKWWRKRRNAVKAIQEFKRDHRPRP